MFFSDLNFFFCFFFFNFRFRQCFFFRFRVFRFRLLATALFFSKTYFKLNKMIDDPSNLQRLCKAQIKEKKIRWVSKVDSALYFLHDYWWFFSCQKRSKLQPTHLILTQYSYCGRIWKATWGRGDVEIWTKSDRLFLTTGGPSHQKSVPPLLARWERYRI